VTSWARRIALAQKRERIRGSGARETRKAEKKQRGGGGFGVLDNFFAALEDPFSVVTTPKEEVAVTAKEVAVTGSSSPSPSSSSSVAQSVRVSSRGKDANRKLTRCRVSAKKKNISNKIEPKPRDRVRFEDNVTPGSAVRKERFSMLVRSIFEDERNVKGETRKNVDTKYDDSPRVKKMDPKDLYKRLPDASMHPVLYIANKNTKEINTHMRFPYLYDGIWNQNEARPRKTDDGTIPAMSRLKSERRKTENFGKIDVDGLTRMLYDRREKRCRPRKRSQVSSRDYVSARIDFERRYRHGCGNLECDIQAQLPATYTADTGYPIVEKIRALPPLYDY